MSKLEKIWEFKDLRNKIIVAVGLLLITRLLSHIPLPGVDLQRLQTFFQQNQAFGLLNMFSGGTMSNFSIILMGVGPYITSSIIFQLLGMIFPSVEEMQKEYHAQIDEKFIILEKQIKEIGEFEIQIIIKKKKSSFKLIVERE